MNTSPRRKQNIKQSSSISPKFSYSSNYMTSTKKSPYLENPIYTMYPPSPISAVKKKSKTQPIIIPNPIQTKYDRSPRKFVPITNQKKDYKNQAELLSKVGKIYNENDKYTFQQQKKLGSSYRFNHFMEYEASKIRTQQTLNIRYNEELKEQRKLNKQSKTAIENSYSHDLFYEDNIFPFHHKDLRVIPVTDRCDTFYHIKVH